MAKVPVIFVRPCMFHSCCYLYTRRTERHHRPHVRYNDLTTTVASRAAPATSIQTACKARESRKGVDCSIMFPTYA